MSVTIPPTPTGQSASAQQTDPQQAEPKKRLGHTRARAPEINLDQPGRLRVAHLLSLLSVSHSTLYAGIKSGRYPKPDGMDGKIPYWWTSTIRPLLMG